MEASTRGPWRPRRSPREDGARLPVQRWPLLRHSRSAGAVRPRAARQPATTTGTAGGDRLADGGEHMAGPGRSRDPSASSTMPARRRPGRVADGRSAVRPRGRRHTGATSRPRSRGQHGGAEPRSRRAAPGATPSCSTSPTRRRGAGRQSAEGVGVRSLVAPRRGVDGRAVHHRQDALAGGFRAGGAGAARQQDGRPVRKGIVGGLHGSGEDDGRGAPGEPGQEVGRPHSGCPCRACTTAPAKARPARRARRCRARSEHARRGSVRSGKAVEVLDLQVGHARRGEARAQDLATAPGRDRPTPGSTAMEIVPPVNGEQAGTGHRQARTVPRPSSAQTASASSPSGASFHPGPAAAVGRRAGACHHLGLRRGPARAVAGDLQPGGGTRGSSPPAVPLVQGDQAVHEDVGGGLARALEDASRGRTRNSARPQERRRCTRLHVR